MKYILLLVFLFTLANADEIQRIESIVKDIENLRKKYETSQEELILLQENNKKQNEKIVKLKNQIIIYKKQAETKEKKSKKKKKKNKVKTCKPVKVKPKIIYKTRKLENPNKFPKLMMKLKYVEYVKKTMKAKTYRLKVTAKVYDGVNGEQIQTWQKNTAFTSNEKAVSPKQDTWVKVTGYFIKNSWVPTRKTMWIKQKYIK